MGQIAEDELVGMKCSLCGQYFSDGKGGIYEHGYPVVCWDDWPELTKAERKLYQRAEVKTL